MAKKPDFPGGGKQKAQKELIDITQERDILKSFGHLHQKTVDRYRFIRGYTKLFSVKKMCQVLKVSRSGYYDWVKYPLSKRRIKDMKLKQKITEIYTNSRKTYGSPRIHQNCYGKTMLLVKSEWKG